MRRQSFSAWLLLPICLLQYVKHTHRTFVVSILSARWQEGLPESHRYAIVCLFRGKFFCQEIDEASNLASRALFSPARPGALGDGVRHLRRADGNRAEARAHRGECSTGTSILPCSCSGTWLLGALCASNGNPGG